MFVHQFNGIKEGTMNAKALTSLQQFRPRNHVKCLVKVNKDDIQPFFAVTGTSYQMLQSESGIQSPFALAEATLSGRAEGVMLRHLVCAFK